MDTNTSAATRNKALDFLVDSESPMAIPTPPVGTRQEESAEWGYFPVVPKIAGESAFFTRISPKPDFFLFSELIVKPAARSS